MVPPRPLGSKPLVPSPSGKASLQAELTTRCVRREIMQMLMAALAEQPADFVARVVVASIESNLDLASRKRLREVQQPDSFGPDSLPAEWQDDASVQMQERYASLLRAQSASCPVACTLCAAHS